MNRSPGMCPNEAKLRLMHSVHAFVRFEQVGSAGLVAHRRKGRKSVGSQAVVWRKDALACSLRDLPKRDLGDVTLGPTSGFLWVCAVRHLGSTGSGQ
jgi:hypothetical protein